MKIHFPRFEKNTPFEVFILIPSPYIYYVKNEMVSIGICFAWYNFFIFGITFGI